VSCGAKHSVYNSLLATVNPGDDVIIFAPYWMTYADQIRLAGGRPVVCPTNAANGFLPDPEQFASLVTPKTKAVIVNSPCNPTGADFPAELLMALGKVALDNGLWIISDEIYEHLVYEGEQHSLAALMPELQSQTITISGFSKTYSMTGWRLGYLHAPVAVAKAISNIQDQVTSNPTSFAQFGAIEALKQPASLIEDMRAKFAERRTAMVEGMATIPGFKANLPHGAFYVFADVRDLVTPECDDVDLANRLLEEAHVAVVPGSVFGGPGHLRFSYALDVAGIKRGLSRIAAVLSGS
jgi:aspartate aminotransferase